MVTNEVLPAPLGPSTTQRSSPFTVQLTLDRMGLLSRRRLTLLSRSTSVIAMSLTEQTVVQRQRALTDGLPREVLGGAFAACLTPRLGTVQVRHHVGQRTG